MTNQRLVIGVLTFERPDLLAKTLADFYRWLAPQLGKLTMMIYDNGSRPEIETANRNIARKHGAWFITSGISVPETADAAERDQRISAGHCFLTQQMMTIPGDAYMLLEDDWGCSGSAPIQPLLGFLGQNLQFGQIRLRKYRYDGTLTGGSRHNFVTGAPIMWERDHPVQGALLRAGNLHWTNNPSLFLRHALDIVAKGYRTELDCMRAFAAKFPQNLQLVPGIFHHTGPWRSRPDLVEIGVLKI